MALGRSWLNAGWVDACVVGGCDVLSPTALAAFYSAWRHWARPEVAESEERS
jgi:hypothetical protein